jgi:hypothetical protein
MKSKMQMLNWKATLVEGLSSVRIPVQFNDDVENLPIVEHPANYSIVALSLTVQKLA